MEYMLPGDIESPDKVVHFLLSSDSGVNLCTYHMTDMYGRESDSSARGMNENRLYDESET